MTAARVVAWVAWYDSGGTPQVDEFTTHEAAYAAADEWVERGRVCGVSIINRERAVEHLARYA